MARSPEVGLSSKAARQKVLAYLRQCGSATTIELREQAGVMSPAPRILELREQGHNIQTAFEEGTTADGARHKRVARYVLCVGGDCEH